MLDIDGTKLPAAYCSDYKKAAGKIMPKSAAFVFPTYFMNRPASMFGHTFIRIDSEYQSKLLGHAVNYSAFTGMSGGMLYALKGVFGYYKGYFSILPYYEKVKEYSDIEQRDMWEYNLNLTEDELQKMLMHIWDLKDIYSYYYFFDENCSYNILFLLEAARPSLHLTDRSGFWVIPVDTLRAVRESGLVESVRYRPSKAAMINHIASLMREGEKTAAKKIAEGGLEPESLPLNPDNGEAIKKVFDLSAEMIQYKSAKGELSKEDYIKRFLSVLKARSKLKKTAEDSYNVTVPAEPEKGHRSARIGLGIGLKEQKPFQEIMFRPALHDIFDPDAGYLEGSQIVFSDIKARYYINEKKLKLEGIDVIDIVSISPRGMFFKPFSWKVSTGFARKILHDDFEHMVYYLKGGYGLAFKNEIAGIYYIFAESEANLSERLNDKYSLGFGVTTGLLKQINSFSKVNFSLGAMHYELGDRHRTYTAMVSPNFRITANNSITISLSGVKTYDIYSNEARLVWNFYF